MSSSWDTYNDRDESHDWCKTHNAYSGGASGCSKCNRESQEKGDAARDKARRILRDAGFDLSTISFSYY